MRHGAIDRARAARDNHHMRMVGASALVKLLALGALLGLGLPRARAAGADYEVGPGDVLKVIVVGQAELTSSFTVDTEGMVNLPILGKVKASEHTTLELERKLTTLLVDGQFLKRPQVTVTVAEFGSQKVFVAGEVQKPGQYALRAERTLLVLLGDIGPLGANSGHEVVVVRPPAVTPAPPSEAATTSSPAGGGVVDDGLFPAESPPSQTATEPPPPSAADPQPPAGAAPPPGVPGLPFVAPGSEVFHISLLELQSGNPEKNIALHAGDTVFFPRASQVYVMGSVARPGSYRFQEGMTVLQALTLAGGATERGSEGRTRVVRIVGGRKVEKKAKATDPVLPEDTLFVPEKFF